MIGFFGSRQRAKPRLRVLEECRRAKSAEPDSRRIKACGRASPSGRRRIAMCTVVFGVAFCSLAVKLTTVSIVETEPRQTVAGDRQKVRELAEITDRNGTLLATNLPMRQLEIVGNEIWDVAETVNALKNVIPDIDAEDLTTKLANGRYVSLRESLTPTDAQAIFDLGLPGIRFNSIATRYYPQNKTASHLIGHLRDGRSGVMGLESILSVQDRNRRADLVASIDLRVQQILERAISDGVRKFHAKAGWGGVMDVRTGEVIALASIPDFDPNNPGGYPDESRRNRAIYDRYEFGSAFKVFTAAIALETGNAEEMTPYNARFGSYQVADRIIRDYHGENRVLTLSEVVQHSSNIGAARMAAEIGVKDQRKMLRRLGLLDALDIKLNEKRSPELPWQWGPVEAATISYGHGLSVTPLHLLTAFSSVVNGGEYRDPVFISGEKSKTRHVFSKKTSFVMRRILRRVITNGTASGAEVPGYFPIGKTATADKPANGGYDRSNRLSSFIGAFPGHNPRYAVLISLDEPKPIDGTYGFATAGWNAAPIFADVTRQVAPILGILPTDEDAAVRAFVSFDGPHDLQAEYTTTQPARGSR